jgi:transcriptional regulator
MASFYIPAHFRIDPDTSLLLDIVRGTNLATLVTAGLSATDGKAGMHATHLPMLVKERQLNDGNTTLQLVGHIAKSNPQWKLFDFTDPETKVLAIFTPPSDVYISPSYYPTKKETGKVVPTWDYQAVHVSGRLEIITDRNQLLEIVSTLTSHHESKIGSAWKVSDAPEAYIETMLKGIVGLVLHVEKIEGTNKMSQNRPADLASVQENLKKRGEKADGERTVEDVMAGRAAEIMSGFLERK